MLHYPSIVDNFRIDLSSQSSTQTIIEAPRDALKSSPILSKMSCLALQYLRGGDSVSTTMSLYQKEIRDVVGKAFVLEILTKSSMEDHVSLTAVIQSMDGPQKKNFYDFTRDTDEYEGILSSLKLFERVSFNANSIEYIDTKMLQTNILEAVKVDIDRGMTQNARVGLSLVAALRTGKVSHGPLSRNWVDAYISWNMAFIFGSGRPIMLYKLMIPSVANAMTDKHSRDMFIIARMVSLAISLMAFNDDWWPIFRFESSPELVIDFGETNVEMVRLAPVSKESVIDMMFELCDDGKLCASKSRAPTGTFPHDYWSDEEYKIY